MWFTEYFPEIQTDFAAIYGILDVYSLDGPFFVRFASRLVYYQGAVTAKIQYDYQQSSENGETSSSSTSEKPVSSTKMSMTQAMGKYGDELDALNFESEATGGDTLFERVSVPAGN